MADMDLTFYMTTGHNVVVPKVSEEEFKNLMQGWVEGTQPVVGMPGADGGMKYLARQHIAMVEVTNYVQ